MNSHYSVDAFIFDVYHIEDKVYVWLLTGDSRVFCLLDTFYPVIYASGPGPELQKLNHRLLELGALVKPPEITVKKHFYKNRDVTAYEYTLARPSFLRIIQKKLFAFYQRLEIYHSDIEPAVYYMYAKNIYPLAYVKVFFDHNRLIKKYILLEPHETLLYKLPAFRIMRMGTSGNHRLGLSKNNPLQVEFNGQVHTLPMEPASLLLSQLNSLIRKFNPDIIITTHGDQSILPVIFSLAQQHKIRMLFDREKTQVSRRIITRGTSYHSYGNTIFRAASYPFFGRWHIDSKNSFLFKESDLAGIIELSRLSRLPAQRMSRASTGQALTAMQTYAALSRGYLVPWQKSHSEEPRSAADLLRADKGGLIYEPVFENDNMIYQNVAQLDFSQMYPTIMVNHNISPETVICHCCLPTECDAVPEVNYRVCRKRRGIVPLSLEPILKRRRDYKKLKNTATGSLYDIIDKRQASIKWLLVTCFGYLGYRNAKFGRLESHEAVTAFGRDKLLTAKTIAENNGYRMLHAITDCIFIQKPDKSAFKTDELNKLCNDIYQATGIEMSTDGMYSWLVFVPSRIDKNMPVANRYFGLFENSSIKMRGLFARRSDMPRFIQQFQQQILEIMSRYHSIIELQKKHHELVQLFEKKLTRLKNGNVKIKDLMFRRTSSKEAGQYKVNNAAAVILKQLNNLHTANNPSGISLQPGEKIKYLQIKKYNQKTYLSEEEIALTCNLNMLIKDTSITIDQKVYTDLLWQSFQEVWQYFAEPGFFSNGYLLGTLFFLIILIT